MTKTQGRRQTPISILDWIQRLYSGITVFHAARPADVGSYYRYGLRLCHHIELTDTARAIFLSEEFPEINERIFDAAVKGLNGIDDGKSYVTLDDRYFLKHSGHYLIYGSEHICGIAAGLSRNGGKDYRQVLKRFGRPTIFKLSLPFTLIDQSDSSDLAELVHEWVPRVRAGRLPTEIDFTFLLRQALPPASIITHEHPRIIIDPLLPMHPEYRFTD